MAAIDGTLSTPVHFGLIDHSAENSGVLLNMAAIEDDGSNIPDIITSMGLLKTAIALVTLLNFTNITASVTLDRTPATLPSSVYAQRELALRFLYTDTVTNKKYSYTVPAPDTSFIAAGTDEIPLSNLAIAAFITVVEANCVSPDGNPITHTGVRLVGRNS